MLLACILALWVDPAAIGQSHAGFTYRRAAGSGKFAVRVKATCVQRPWAIAGNGGVSTAAAPLPAFADYDPFDDGGFCRSRFWLFLSYVVSFASLIAAVWVLVQHYGEGHSWLEPVSSRPQLHVHACCGCLRSEWLVIPAAAV